MAAEKAKPICAHPLSQGHRAVLLWILGNLIAFLNCPGDWGYGTRLGDLYTQLVELRNDIMRGKDGPDGA